MSESIFQNSDVLENIIKFVSGDFKEIGKLRLINKSFNSSVISIFRSQFSKIDLQCSWDPNPRFVVVNNQPFDFEHFILFLNFLKSPVNVNLKELTLIRFNFMEENLKFERAICNLIKGQNLVKLVGFKHRCFLRLQIECQSCLSAIENCDIYGPTEQGFWSQCRNRDHHFKQLQVDQETAMLHVMFKAFQNLRLRDDMPTAPVRKFTCDHLIVAMDKYCDFELSPTLMKNIIDDWEVKTIGIKPYFVVGPKDSLSSHLIKREYSMTKSFPIVTIDLTEFLGYHLLSDSLKEFREFCFPIHQNLLNNVLQVFPTKKIQLIYPPDFRMRMKSFIESLLEKVEASKVRDLEITMNPVFKRETHFIDYKIDGIPLEVIRGDFPPSVHYFFDHESKRERKFIGRKMTLRDEEWNLTLIINYLLMEMENSDEQQVPSVRAEETLVGMFERLRTHRKSQ